MSEEETRGSWVTPIGLLVGGAVLAYALYAGPVWFLARFSPRTSAGTPTAASVAWWHRSTCPTTSSLEGPSRTVGTSSGGQGPVTA